MNATQEAFFYVDGIPTKGEWIDLDDVSDTDDVLVILADKGLVPKDEDGEPVYGGDLLVADVDGELAREFLSKRDTFDLSGFKECAEDLDTLGYSYEAGAAYLKWAGSWSRSHFQDAYCGEWDSEVAYAEELCDDLYLASVPSSVQSYIDYEKLARDLFLDGHHFEDGHVFRDC